MWRLERFWGLVAWGASGALGMMVGMVLGPGDNMGNAGGDRGREGKGKPSLGQAPNRRQSRRPQNARRRCRMSAGTGRTPFYLPGPVAARASTCLRRAASPTPASLQGPGPAPASSPGATWRRRHRLRLPDLEGAARLAAPRPQPRPAALARAPRRVRKNPHRARKPHVARPAVGLAPATASAVAGGPNAPNGRRGGPT